MQHLPLALALASLTLQQAVQKPAPELPLEELLTARELENHRKQSKYKDRIDFFRKIFDRRSELLRRYVKRHQYQETVALLVRLRALARHVQDDSPRRDRQKDLAAKEVKKLEIRLRKLMETLEDLKSVTPFEFHLHFDRTASRLEDLRRQLLGQIFGDDVLASEGELAEGSSASNAFAGLSLKSPSSSGLQSRPGGDRFTEEEYNRLQKNQELQKRVEVLLKIAESRLQEIHRRGGTQDWEMEEGHALEFHTYWDMVHAYWRALDSIMINIDEKAESGTASAKEIHNSLKLLSQKVREFLPALESIKALAADLRDEALYREVLKAEEITQIAQKGSQYGLEAPEP